MAQKNDRTGNWLIDLHGSAILRIAGFAGCTSWKAVKSELTLPKRIPDGLIEARFAGEKEPELFLIEIETYSDPDVDRQVMDGMVLTQMIRQKLPEPIVLILRPKGNQRPSGKHVWTSKRRAARISGEWTVIELWKLNAEDLFAMNEVGIIPWIPLTHTEQKPEDFLKRCRDEIEARAKPDDVDTLLTATRLLASTVFKATDLLDILVRSAKMNVVLPDLERWKEELMAEAVAKAVTEGEFKARRAGIVEILEERFVVVPESIRERLQTVSSLQRLGDLHRFSVRCADLAAFETELNRIDVQN